MRRPVAGKVVGRKGEQGKAKRGKAAGSKPEQRSAVKQRATPAKGGPCPDVQGEAEPVGAAADARRGDVAADKARGPAGGAMGKAVQGRSVKGKAARTADKAAPQKRAVEPAA